MNSLVIDTEYRFVPGLERFDAATGEERIPHPPNAIIESLAYCLIKAGPVTPLSIKIGVVGAPTEKERVSRFLSSWLSNERPNIVTFNGRRCDVPLIVARCGHHRIQCGKFYSEIHLANRYSGKHIDLYDELGAFGSMREGGLADWAQAFGWPGKLGVDGSKVAGLIADGKRAEVDAYCLADAVQTAGAYLARCHIAEVITTEQYDMAGRELLRVVEADARVQHVAELVDRAVWLGEEKRAA
jgi:predicted PolB exonuclease-like 3'-5' exonuclease